MSLPRWTVYPALAVIVGILVIAIPKRTDADPNAGAAHVKSGDLLHKPVVVLGIDGLDPDILAEVIEIYPERMENFRWLIEQADGIQPLGTSTPPQSPVAWSNFITGQDPGGHGIFDFIHRDLETRGPLGSTSVTEEGGHISLPGPWIIPTGGDSYSNRTGDSFWKILADNGVPADIWRMPANFPVEPSKGVSFPGMMTPALDSAYGECTLLTSNPGLKYDLGYKKVGTLQEAQEDEYIGTLNGPPNPMREYPADEPDKFEKLPVTVLVDRTANAAVIEVGKEKVVLQPGQWSHFLRVDYEMLPLGAMNLSGVCRFYLRSLEPEIELYISPVNLSPESPPAPVSEPSSASADLAEGIGLYYTQGMAEDVNALKNGVLADNEFMSQVELVYVERKRMLDYAIDRYLEDDEGGLLFFYFSTVDLACHMMWRHHDSAHPAHDPQLAAADSSAWSKRNGSVWADTVHDLYLRMDPVLGRVRERLGDDTTLIVMSDHGFAPFRRMFNLNTWLLEEGYLVLKDGEEKELPRNDPDHKKVHIFFEPEVGEDGEIAWASKVDWTKTRAYGMGFNGLYLNLAQREKDNPQTPDIDESGIVDPAQAEALLREIKGKLEAVRDDETGLRPILRCDLATDVYSGERLDNGEAPDILVGFNAGYGNSDASSTGRIPHEILEDNAPATFGGKLGTFNGSHLMAPEVVSGTLLSNKPVQEGQHRLEDLTVEILKQYGIDPPAQMKGHPVLK